MHTELYVKGGMRVTDLPGVTSIGEQSPAARCAGAKWRDFCFVFDLIESHFKLNSLLIKCQSCILVKMFAVMVTVCRTRVLVQG